MYQAVLTFLHKLDLFKINKSEILLIEIIFMLSKELIQ